MRLNNGDEVVIEMMMKPHDRKAFDCEEETLNSYLQKSAGQNARRRIGQTYVATLIGEKRVLGY